jgi:hypothetical protein
MHAIIKNLTTFTQLFRATLYMMLVNFIKLTNLLQSLHFNMGNLNKLFISFAHLKKKYQ